MANSNKTLLVYVLDRSGSMSEIQSTVIEGINKMIDEQAKLEGELAITMAEFDHHYNLIYNNLSVENVAPRSSKNFIPRGYTALIDAMCFTIDEVTHSINKLPVYEKPANVIFVCYTDGMENSSRAFTAKDLKEKIRLKEKEYNWKFMYMGAHPDAFREAKQFGFNDFSTVQSSSDSKSIADSYAYASANLVNYRRGMDYDSSAKVAAKSVDLKNIKVHPINSNSSAT